MYSNLLDIYSGVRFLGKVYAHDQLCYILTNNFQSSCTDLFSVEEYGTLGCFTSSLMLGINYLHFTHSGRYAVLVHHGLIVNSRWLLKLRKFSVYFDHFKTFFFLVKCLFESFAYFNWYLFPDLIDLCDSFYIFILFLLWLTMIYFD